MGRRRLLAEHVGPELHELALVEAAVAVRVEHLHHGDGRLLIYRHHLLYHVHHFLWTQHSVAVFVQLGKTPRYVVISTITHTHTQHGNYYRGGAPGYFSTPSCRFL